MNNTIDNVITNSQTISKKKVSKEEIKKIIEQFYNSILNNKDAIMLTNEIDIKNSNGFKLNFNIIDRIFKNIQKESIYCGETIYTERNDEKKFIYGKYLTSKGTILTINEGNTYIILEMILKNIIANNIHIINTPGYMYGTNNFLIVILQTILEKNGYSKYQTQIFNSETCEDLLKRYTSIDLVVCIGNHNLQMFVRNHCKNELILSGYENFDIYLETTKFMKLINKIINQNVPIQFYINKKINVEIENAIIVDDIEEAVAQMNFNGNGYSTAIFTEDNASACYFLENIKSKIQTINTSPTIERICDINQQSLMSEKTIIFPIGNFSDRLEFYATNMIKENKTR